MTEETTIVTPTMQAPLVPEGTLKKAILLEGDIAVLNNRIKDIEATIADEISAIREEIAAKQSEHDALVSSVVAAGVYEQDIYVVLNKARVTRVVNPLRFKQAFPELFDTLASIPVTKAEAVVGKVQLAPLCDTDQGRPVWAVTRKSDKLAKTTAGWWK
jgi:hypothetical protein